MRRDKKRETDRNGARGKQHLVEAIYPNAETADAIVMALSYCRARNLDHIQAAGPHCADVVERGRQDDRDGVARDPLTPRVDDIV